MLGSSGGDRFLVILPDQPRASSAAEFLARVAQSLGEITGKLSLVWSATENLGDWTIVRKRLQDGMREGVKPQAAQPGYFDAFTAQGAGADRIPRDLREATAIGWSFDFPALIAAEAAAGLSDTRIVSGAGISDTRIVSASPMYRWEIGTESGISVTRHGARNGDAFATTKELARRAHGQRLWGVLRGEIDDYSTRMRRLQSVEEHVVLSMLYRQFLASAKCSSCARRANTSSA